ncbi:hypothetical protein [Bradyrhizobium lablabi]|uniref:hypothetical protein n=1 Tax=Bradyrhizobium lablabi TaxID=722472 RepID=UPI001BAC9211|nr:hypothetical protein [Bradyrhizobium lablabi]MBR0693604.1 hypothetical protein [Bradyrhizobium lablabi]
MKITRTSIITGKVSTMDLPITAEQMAKYDSGALVQDAFPHLTADQREFILTGITADEWDRCFGDGNDDDAYLKDAQADLSRYAAHLAKGETDACIAIEQKYGLFGLSPQMVSEELADIAAEFAELNQGEASVS